MFEKLFTYMQLPFVQYLFIGGILISICASLLGVILVLKHYSYIGDGLSHVAFLGLAIASVLNLTNNMPFIMIVTIACAILLLAMPHKGKIKADALIALASVSALAIGYLLLNIFPSSSNIAGDICTTLFGSTNILTLSLSDVWLCVGVFVVVIVIFVILYNRIFAVTFDEDFSKASGMNVTFFNIVLAILIGAVIVLAMKIVGSLLTTALIIFPSLTSMRYCKSFKSIVISSVIVSVVSSLFGIIVAILAGTPVGSTIVCFELVLFLIACIFGKVLAKK